VVFRHEELLCLTPPYNAPSNRLYTYTIYLKQNSKKKRRKETPGKNIWRPYDMEVRCVVLSRLCTKFLPKKTKNSTLRIQLGNFGLRKYISVSFVIMRPRERYSIPNKIYWGGSSQGFSEGAKNRRLLPYTRGVLEECFWGVCISTVIYPVKKKKIPVVYLYSLTSCCYIYIVYKTPHERFPQSRSEKFVEEENKMTDPPHFTDQDSGIQPPPESESKWK